MKKLGLYHCFHTVISLQLRCNITVKFGSNYGQYQRFFNGLLPFSPVISWKFLQGLKDPLDHSVDKT